MFRLQFITVLFLIFFYSCEDPVLNQAVTADSSGFQWPGGRKTAVCLTYDDGLDCHLDVVQPVLDKFNFKGSFYCTGKSESLANRMSDWKALVAAGHELGNHSLFHPCLKVRAGRDTFNWILPEYDLDNYSLSQIKEELELANVLLNSVDGHSRRTYAYTCSDHWVNGESYVDTIRPMFEAARCKGPIPDDMKKLDLHLMPSVEVEEVTGQQLIEYAKEAAQKGTMLTIMFHSVGGGYLNVSKEAHRELLDYLYANPDVFWVDTFMKVTDHIRKERKRLRWQ